MSYGVNFRVVVFAFLDSTKMLLVVVVVEVCEMKLKTMRNIHVVVMMQFIFCCCFSVRFVVVGEITNSTC